MSDDFEFLISGPVTFRYIREEQIAKPMRRSLVLALLCTHFIGYGTTFQVGPGKPYPTPNALYLAGVVQDGDMNEIDHGDYIGTDCLAHWDKDSLFIYGNPGGTHMIANGAYILGKGIWVLSGNDITVMNIEFSGATVPDKNGAGIRLDGIGLTVISCYFHDNENGILTSNQGVGDIVITESEFANNGYGDGFSHNLYVGHVRSLIFLFNYSHHANVGHNLKSRAENNFIYYNRIMDEETGNSSRLVDLPNGGFSIVMGNLFMQGNNAENNNLVGYGQEGLSNPENELYFVNNTLVNKRQVSCVFVDIDGQPDSVEVVNNIFAGTGTVTHGKITRFGNNLREINIADVRFENEAIYDYRIRADSPARDYGITLPPAGGNALIPGYEYAHPRGYHLRQGFGAIDAGAYEYESTSAVERTAGSAFSFWPNPTNGKIQLELNIVDIELIRVCDLTGKCVMTTQGDAPDLTLLRSGVYVMQILMNDGSIRTSLVTRI